MIIFENATKKYGDHTVLDRVNCEIGGGEFVSVVGPSGAGKTTFVNLLTGAIHPTEGKVSVDNYQINQLDEISRALYLRKVGVIFQDYKLLPKKTVFENIAFALEVCGDASSLIRKRTDEVIEIVGLTHRRNAFPANLSGGECQRTALARALVHEPALIIGDEPTGNLDPQSGEEIINLLLDVNKAGATVILATHDRDTVNRIQKRVIRIENGKLISDLKSGGYHHEPESMADGLPTK
ncbi:ATP-binding cassette domain-containing protein [Candidatus Gracilibacteria bacterium]|nr:ATP-binding cassette domain-containing protein [Candidatus Gracilibacteria bacterium]MCF7856256.1 ATP-binding cassette domain-containing protein [Candidatus Gracilibacteria bacterium]MCF7896265.1 ATP-binding cassette domain-containing protein [Candidatus Gracilibacteria bacterium]